MKLDFSYLDDYVIEKKGQYVGKNAFNLLTEDEIDEGEKILENHFPKQLKVFYKQVGCGTLWQSIDKNPDTTRREGNEILPPIAAANFAKGILFWEGQRNWMSEDAYEDLQPGDLPFFEIGDSSSFLIMKINSDNPNAVWRRKIKITDSFEEFIYRLYYEKPDFYDDVIIEHYKKRGYTFA